MQPINKPPLKLLFGTPEFIDGIQTTVRVGVKWRDLVGTKRLKNIPVFIPGKEAEGEIGRAEITGTLFGQFRELASVGSKFNHQENCRTVKGLAKVLAECYPDFDPETSQVTVVFFKFTAPEPIVEETEDETEAVEETEESDDDTENERSEESSGEETSSEEIDGSSEESSAEKSD